MSDLPSTERLNQHDLHFSLQLDRLYEKIGSNKYKYGVDNVGYWSAGPASL